MHSSRPHRRGFLGLLALIPALAGCELPLGACNTSALPGLVIAVVDSASGAPARGDEIVVIATDGASADTIRHASAIPDEAGRVALAYENAGTYRVEVRVTGYRLWSRNGVRVSADRCHVRTVHITARLQR